MADHQNISDGKKSGARYSSVVRELAYGTIGHRIDPSWLTH